MNYDTLLDCAVMLGYKLAISGAETYRIEESISKILQAYEINAEVFAIPNCIFVGITTQAGTSISRVKRIPFHGTDLHRVEKYSNLSRRICTEKPDPEQLHTWIEETERSARQYRFPVLLLANFLVAFGFAFLFGGALIDAVCAGICALAVGFTTRAMEKLHANLFFNTLLCAALLALCAYLLSIAGIAKNSDTVIIGALMLLVPGLLITNAMRDIIFGDITSGTNRIVQTLLVAAAIICGTGIAWNIIALRFSMPEPNSLIEYHFLIQILASFIACLGCSLVFNIQGRGIVLCVLGGGISWGVYWLASRLSGSIMFGYFCAGAVSALYSEIMARIRKYPAISYLVISIMPMIPGAGVYYTTDYLMRGDMASFAAKGTQTLAIAGIIAVSILTVSTLVRLFSVWKNQKK